MTIVDPFKLAGAVGLVCISAGILIKDRKRQDWLYIIGGLLLESYSFSIGDLIFMALQIIFTVAAVYDLACTCTGKKAKISSRR